jgi:SAM-dependent methyltransferase
MSDRNTLFTGYLTRHLSHVTDPHQFRKRKKDHLLHNYGHVIPKDRDARILEIGPGYGELLELLAVDRGYTHVQGIDLSQEVADFCNSFLPQSTLVVEDTVAFLAAHAGHFDCIFMFHVLEHIPKLEIPPMLRAIYQALKPGGAFVLEVPNMANPFIGLNFRYADFTHEVGFTEMSMTYVLEHAGFQQIAIFEPKILNDRYERIFQSAARKAVNLTLTFIYRAYASRRPRVVSPVLCASGVRVDSA